MNRIVASLRLACFPWFLIASVIAQAESFDEAARLGVDQVEAARSAVQAFLRLEPGPVRVARLEVAARCAFVASEFELCVAWCTEAEEATAVSEPTERARLRALLAMRRSPAFLAAAKDAAGRTPAALRAVLVAEEAICLQIADSTMRSGDVEGGLWLFRQIAELQPVSPARSCNLALALRHAGQLAQSQRTYQEAIALAPGDAWSWNDYGLLLRIMGDQAGAADAFQRSLACDLESGQGPAVTNLVLAAVLEETSETRRKEALAIASKALALRPDAALLRRAAIDLALGPKTRARQELETDTAGARR